jgi:hypothetical protein
MSIHHKLRRLRPTVIARTRLSGCRCSLIIACLVLACGIGSTTGIDSTAVRPPKTEPLTLQRLSGVFPLNRIAGQSLPADLGPVPMRDGSPPTCHFLVREGSLTIIAATAGFSIAYETRNSCSDAVLGDQGSTGAVSLSRDTLTFVANLQPGQTRTYFGRVTDTTLTAENDYFVFRRPTR